MFLGADGKKRSALSPKTIKRFFLSEPGGRVAEGSASNLTWSWFLWSQINSRHVDDRDCENQVSQDANFSGWGR